MNQRKSKKSSNDRPKLPSTGEPIADSVLCIGIDVAWWGGQTGNGAAKKDTRSECLAFAMRRNGSWGKLSIKRVDLNDTYNSEADNFTPNADPHATTLLTAIEEVLHGHKTDSKVVIALDAPLRARPRPNLSRPRKVIPRGESGDEYRECDKTWQEEKRKSPNGWRDIKVLPGANPAPRLKNLVNGLKARDVSLFANPNDPVPRKVAIECFPNEVIWSAGVLGYAGNFSSASLLAYKKLGKSGKITLPSDVFEKVWRHTLTPALKVAGLDDNTCEQWLSTFGNSLYQDNVVTQVPPEGGAGKKFDDAVDSMLSLTAAVGFADGCAHVHQDGVQDGHIIGPGVWPAEEDEA